LPPVHSSSTGTAPTTSRSPSLTRPIRRPHRTTRSNLNSIDTTADGKLLVSARNTWTVYKIDPASGDIVWRLGGKNSDFSLGPGVRFAWQHDARVHADGTITLFDDEGDPPEAKQSRGITLQMDETNKTATLARSYTHPLHGLLAGSQGSMQVLPNGNVMIGWGAEPYYTEFQSDGTMVLDAKFAKGTSYRAFRFDWTGTPTDRPAVAAGQTKAGHPALFASWNGATETAAWRVLEGPTATSLQPTGQVPRQGFETTIPLEGTSAWAAVQALDCAGTLLGQSPSIRS
jgi:hypothetical protein